MFSFYRYVTYIKVIIRDYGSQFDQKSLKQSQNDLINLEGSGLGMYLIRACVDKLEYVKHNQGTEVILIKYLRKGV